mgnify:CR=1 FL=1
MKRTLLIICTLLCANVLSAQGWFLVGQVYYLPTSSNEVSVYGTNINTLTDLVIPSTVTYGTTFNVTSIESVDVISVVDEGVWGFSPCSSLTSVTIPNSVTSIGERAFSGCSSLTSVNIPNSVTSIGNFAFKNCSSLTSVNIPNSVTSIEYGVFSGCSSLTSVNIPNSIASIGDYAFKNCSSLTSITIPNSVTSIGESAFEDCSSLTSVTFGESLAEIGERAFATASFLQNITCLGTNPPILYNNSFPYPNIATVTVPCGSLEAYSAPTSYWNMLFTDRIEEDCSGIEQAEAESISFFPNPTKSEITFSQAIEKVEVIDLTGKAILTFTNAKTINIESLPAGAYYLRLTNNDKAIIQKVIKQ